ncbi:MAG: DUF4058 family protein [Caldilineaceae bacterium]
MPTPFPGMDPYLERPNLWSNVHSSLITVIRDFLAPRLRPRYFVSVEERSYLDDPVPAGFVAVPDVGVIGPYTQRPVPVLAAPVAVAEPHVIELPMPEQIRETYLSIQEVGTHDLATEMWLESEDGLKVVTILEILSPWNEGSREGRAQYARKREEVINSFTNLVEIDLLRAGQRFVQTRNENYHYNILVSPAPMRPRAHFYPFTVRPPIPAFRLPLQEDDEWPVLDLNRLLHDLYERAGYDLRINYRAEPVPPFTEEDASWLDDLLHQANRR